MIGHDVAHSRGLEAPRDRASSEIQSEGNRVEEGGELGPSRACPSSRILANLRVAQSRRAATVRLPMSGCDTAWDLPDPFYIEVEVEPRHIDDYGHANNAVYLQWCEQVAWAHTDAVGLDFARYRELGRAMAVRRTELHHLAPAFAGDQLRVGNWIVHSDGRLQAQRRYQIQRATDGVTVLRALSHFVCIDLDSGRPRRMPAEFSERYVVEPSVRAALAQTNDPFSRR